MQHRVARAGGWARGPSYYDEQAHSQWQSIQVTHGIDSITSLHLIETLYDLHPHHSKGARLLADQKVWHVIGMFWEV